MNTRDAMRGRWADALREYGINERCLTGKHTPCPMCAGKDRFRFDNKDGLGTWFCSQCGAGDGFKLLMLYTGRPFGELAADLDKRCGNYDVSQERPKADGRKMIAHVAQGLNHLSDIDPVVRYLRGRGIHQIPRDHLRYHAAAYHWEAKCKFPAMVAALRNSLGKVAGYHLTYLNESGGKADVDKQKLYTRGQTGDCVIRLSGVQPHIGLAEGIETALSVTQMYGIPCWATGDAGRLERFLPPEGIEQVTIFADIDHSHTGEAAAENLAKRLILKDRLRVEVRRDCPRGTDYNDLLWSSQQN